MPERQKSLVAMLQDANLRYQAAKTSAKRADERIRMQVGVASFMEESQDAVEWTGVLRESRTTREGDVWVSIEIAPLVTVSNWSSRAADREDLTLIRQGSILSKTIHETEVGQPIVFNATMLVYDVTDDDDMVAHPHLIARFKTIRPLSVTP